MRCEHFQERRDTASRTRAPFSLSRLERSAGASRVVIAGLIVALNLAVYLQTRQFEFVSLDDGLYVFSNPRVKDGLSLAGVAWSFNLLSSSGTHWHPLVWISHMADVQWLGLDPGAHHLVNVGFHILNALLLFAVLIRVTGARWMSAMVAVLFAVHPIQVESVAWIAARKNLLSTLFFLLTVYAYMAYASKPSRRRYAAVTIAFILGLLSKPMLVTLPMVLLLLDYWPLRRLTETWQPHEAALIRRASPMKTGVRVAAEKAPWMILSILSATLALYAVGGFVPTSDPAAPPLHLRLGNALVSYMTYLQKLLWPTGLAMFYPYPLSIPLWKAGLAGLIVGGFSLLFFRWRVKRPFLLVGWLWFIVTLLPVLGVVQAGVWPAWADRWAYIPSIGIFIVLVWGGREILESHNVRKRGLVWALTLSAITLLTAAAYQQTKTWRNDIALYRHAVTHVEDNYFAYNNLAETYHRMRRYQDAEALFAKAIEIAPWFVPAHIGASKTYLESGNIAKAFHHLTEALKMRPYEKSALNNLGVMYLQCGELEKAEHAFKAALAIDSGDVEANNNLGFVYLRTGRLPEAYDRLGKALAFDPGNQMAQDNMHELLTLMNRR